VSDRGASKRRRPHNGRRENRGENITGGWARGWNPQKKKGEGDLLKIARGGKDGIGLPHSGERRS